MYSNLENVKGKNRHVWKTVIEEGVNIFLVKPSRGSLQPIMKQLSVLYSLLVFLNLKFVTFVRTAQFVVKYLKKQPI